MAKFLVNGTLHANGKLLAHGTEVETDDLGLDADEVARLRHNGAFKLREELETPAENAARAAELEAKNEALAAELESLKAALEQAQAQGRKSRATE